MASSRKTPTFDNNPNNPKFAPPRGPLSPAGKRQKPGKLAPLHHPVNPATKSKQGTISPRQSWNPFR
jgi:hypothetical protein